MAIMRAKKVPTEKMLEPEMPHRAPMSRATISLEEFPDLEAKVGQSVSMKIIGKVTRMTIDKYCKELSFDITAIDTGSSKPEPK
jgi:hypothetical protein